MSKPVSVLAVVLPLAFAIRLAVALAFPNVLALDEVFQNLEQAHRVVFGQGVVPWEFQVGLRSWLIPLLLAGPMALAHFFTAAPLAGLVFIRFLLVLASLPIVWCGTQWGEKFYGRPGAWVAGLLTALWPDLWVMAPHPLEEVLAADVLVPAIFLVEASPKNLRFVALAGFLLGVVFILRLQLAPAVAMAGIALCGRNLARWRAGLLAGALVVLAAGLLDWISWGQPFRSFFLNVDLNVFRHLAAAQFGTAPAGFYGSILLRDWLFALPVMVFFAWRGAKKLPVTGIAILVILLTHSLIPHKEFRFIYPAIALAVPLAGVGLAGLWANRPGIAGYFFAALALLGPFCSPWLYFFLMQERASFTGFRYLAAQSPRLVAIDTTRISFVPLDILLTGQTRMTGMTVFNQPAPRPDFVIASRGVPAPPGYHIARCLPGGWTPFRQAPPGFCAWAADAPVADTGAAPPLDFGTPQAAIPFLRAPREGQ